MTDLSIVKEVATNIITAIEDRPLRQIDRRAKEHIDTLDLTETPPKSPPSKPLKRKHLEFAEEDDLELIEASQSLISQKKHGVGFNLLDFLVDCLGPTLFWPADFIDSLIPANYHQDHVTKYNLWKILCYMKVNYALTEVNLGHLRSFFRKSNQRIDEEIWNRLVLDFEHGTFPPGKSYYALNFIRRTCMLIDSMTDCRQWVEGKWKQTYGYINDAPDSESPIFRRR